MIRTILSDLIHLTVPTLIGIGLWVWSVNMGWMPPICGVCALRMEMEQYEAVSVDFMFDKNKD
jgi:hypothetical protein